MPSEVKGSKGDSTPKRDTCVCPICDYTIKKAVGRRQADDAVECSGICAAWLHRKCAGLSKPAYVAVSKSGKPFYCPHCRLTQQEQVIESLQELVGALSAELDTLKKLFVSSPSTIPQVSLAAAAGPASEATPAVSSGTISSHVSARGSAPAVGGAGRHSSSDRKSNLIIFGIEESVKGTLRHVRSRYDIENAGDILSSVDSNVTASSISDCIRLGKYKEERTRPLLVKLLRTSDAQAILANRRQLASRPGINVKPDLTAEQRKSESILLRERRALIESGVERSRIKLRRNSLFVDENKYGYIDDNSFHQCNTDSSSLASSSDSNLLVTDISPVPSSLPLDDSTGGVSGLPVSPPVPQSDQRCVTDPDVSPGDPQ